VSFVQEAPEIGGKITINNLLLKPANQIGTGNVVLPGSNVEAAIIFTTSTTLRVGDALTLTFPPGFLQVSSLTYLQLYDPYQFNTKLSNTAFTDSFIIFSVISAPLPISNGVNVTLRGLKVSQQPMVGTVVLSSTRDYGILWSSILVGALLPPAFMSGSVLYPGKATIRINVQNFLSYGQQFLVTLTYPKSFFSPSFSDNHYSCCESSTHSVSSSTGFGSNSIIFSAQNNAMSTSFILALNTSLQLGPGKFGPIANFTLSTSLSPPTPIMLVDFDKI